MTDTSTPRSRRKARESADAPAATDADTPATNADAQSPLSPEEAAAKAAKIEKIGNIVRYAMMFIMPLIMVGMMITGYLGTMHSSNYRDMPVLVAGDSASSIAGDLSEAGDGALKTDTVTSRLDARDAVHSREAVASVVIESGTATVYTATGAGAQQAQAVLAEIAPALAAQGLTVQTEDVAPLPDGDPGGLGAMFLATALVMAGYLPFSMVRSNSPELLRFRRAVPLMAGWAALIAALVWTVTGPIMHVVDLSHTVAVLGIAWLGVFAIASVQLLLTRLFGSMGVIFGLLFLMVLGMPASGMSMSIYTMPGFYHFLHGILPMPAIGESMRSVLYFGADGLTGHLLVLAAGAVLGLIAVKLFDARQARRRPNAGPLSVNMPSLHGGRRPNSRFWRYLSLLAFPLMMVSMMISVMLGAMHSPAPKDMPVAIVSASAEQAQQTADGMSEQMGDMFDLSVITDEQAARDQVEHRDIVAAFVLPSAGSPEATLITNQAGNNAAATMVDQVFTQVAGAQQMQLTVDDVHPLPERDSNGVVTMYVAMGWILAGFMIVVVGANAAPRSRPLKRMLPLLAAYAPFMSLVVWLIAGPITHAVSGHFLALWGTGILAIASIAAFAMVFERLIGMFAIIPVIGTLMFMGVPSSNGALSQYMTPGIFRGLHDWLPMPAAVEAIRSILYFDGDTVGHWLQVLAIWGLVSLAVVMIIDAIKPVRTEHDFGDMDPRLMAGYRPDQSVPMEPVEASTGPVESGTMPASESSDADSDRREPALV